MIEVKTSPKQDLPEILSIIAALIASVYWVVGTSVNVYRYAVLGAIFELLWLPMLGLLFVVPIFALIRIFRKEGRTVFTLVPILVMIATVLYITICSQPAH